jgi:hypothetical protein
MKTLEFIQNKFNLDLNQKSPIAIREAIREVMAQTLCELGFKVGAEIGVLWGEHAEILCKYNPTLKLYCVDPWIPYKGYHDYHSFQYEPNYEHALVRLDQYDCELIRKFSLDAAKDFEDNSLDFVYIDGNHDFRHVIDDIDEWSKKVKPGGIIYGHDLHKNRLRWKSNQVYYAVPAYLYANRIKPWFVLGVENRNLDNGNGVKAWMYIKE